MFQLGPFELIMDIKGNRYGADCESDCNVPLGPLYLKVHKRSFLEAHR